MPQNVDDAAEKQTFKLGQRLQSTILNPENEVEHEKKDSHLNISEKSLVDTTIETVAKIGNIISTTSMPSIHKSVTSRNP